MTSGRGLRHNAVASLLLVASCAMSQPSGGSSLADLTVVSVKSSPVASTVPHDYQLCLTWQVHGQHLPASSVTRCFAPFELGEWTPVNTARHGFLSPGVHTVSLDMRPSTVTTRPRVPLASASFEPVFDSSVGVEVHVYGTRVSNNDSATDTVVAGVLMTHNDVAVSDQQLENIAEQLGFPVDAVVGVVPHAVSQARAEVASSYDGLPREALFQQEITVNVSLQSFMVPHATARDAHISVTARNGEAHADAALRVCGVFLDDSLVLDPEDVSDGIPGGPARGASGLAGDARDAALARCTAVATDALRDARTSGVQVLTKSLGDHARELATPALLQLRYWDEVDRMEAYIAHLGAFWREGTTANLPQCQGRNLAVITEIRPKLVCEVGFNAGHSSLLWLLSSSNVSVLSFDIGISPAARAAATWLERRFPGRFSFIIGDSEHSMPDFHRARPEVKCDMWFIDGGHSYRLAASDLGVAAAMSSSGSTVVVDDVGCPWDWCRGPRRAWWHAVGTAAVRPKDVGTGAPWVDENGIGVPGTTSGCSTAVGVFT